MGYAGTPANNKYRCCRREDLQFLTVGFSFSYAREYTPESFEPFAGDQTLWEKDPTYSIVLCSMFFTRLNLSDVSCCQTRGFCGTRWISSQHEEIRAFTGGHCAHPIFGARSLRISPNEKGFAYHLGQPSDSNSISAIGGGLSAVESKASCIECCLLRGSFHCKL